MDIDTNIQFEVFKHSLIASSKYYEEAREAIKDVDNYHIHKLLEEDWNNTRKLYLQTLNYRFVDKFFQ